MIRPPAGADLRAALRDGYGFDVERLDAEGEGADAAAWAWRATTIDGRRLFVKLRREVRPAAILVPRHLVEIGFREVVAALPTVTGAAWLDIDGWTAVVMDLVDGETAIRGRMDHGGWHRLGAFAAGLHAVHLPADLAALLRVEDFRSTMTGPARTIDERLDGLDPAGLDELSVAVRDRWIVERDTIRRIVERTDQLGDRIRARRSAADPAGFVVCHADFHAANVLVDRDGAIHVVDWDEVMLAPRERDLMFVRGSVVAGPVSDGDADAFEAGYGRIEVDRERLAWYRLDWAVQDVAGYATQVLFEPDRDPPGRPRARSRFEGQFGPGSQVAIALAADALLPA